MGFGSKSWASYDKKMKSIKMKLIGSIVSIVIAMIIVLVTFSYGKSANVIEEYSEELLSSSVGNQTAQIEAWLKENISSFQMVKTTIEKMHFNDAQIQKILDSFYNYNSNYPQGIYIGDTTGKVMKATEASISVNNIHDEVWYKEGLTRVNMAVSSPYVNSAGEKVISVSGILNDGKNNYQGISDYENNALIKVGKILDKGIDWSTSIDQKDTNEKIKQNYKKQFIDSIVEFKENQIEEIKTESLGEER